MPALTDSWCPAQCGHPSSADARRVTIHKTPLSVFGRSIGVAAFLSVVQLHCGSLSGACSTVPYDQRSSNEISGCYSLTGRVGGLIGGYREERDERACIVLTSDSLLNRYEGDTLRESVKFDLSWKNEGKHGRTAVMAFSVGAGWEDVSVSWRSDTMWIGPSQPYPDAQWSVYVKCR